LTQKNHSERKHHPQIVHAPLNKSIKGTKYILEHQFSIEDRLKKQLSINQDK
jgi:hypothetical protein